MCVCAYMPACVYMCVLRVSCVRGVGGVSDVSVFVCVLSLSEWAHELCHILVSVEA